MAHSWYLKSPDRGELLAHRIEDFRGGQSLEIRRPRRRETPAQEHASVGEPGRPMEAPPLREATGQLRPAGRRIVDLGGGSEVLSGAGAADESASDEHAAVREQGRRMTAAAGQQVLADRPLLGRRVIGFAEGSISGPSP